MGFMFTERFPVPVQDGWRMHPAKAGENLLEIIGHARIVEYEVEIDRPAVLTVNGIDKFMIDENEDGQYALRHGAHICDSSGIRIPTIKGLTFDRDVRFRIKYRVIVG